MWVGYFDDVSGDLGGIGPTVWTGPGADFIEADRFQPCFKIPSGQIVLGVVGILRLDRRRAALSPLGVALSIVQ